MELYNYFRSSASFRVRIALALKGLHYDYKPVHLQKSEQLHESYAAVSASRLVPLLRDGETVLTQSMAIIEYLDETHPEPPLLPKTKTGELLKGPITLHVNGTLKQKGDLSDLIWSVNETIEQMTTAWELAPGDLIFTGTPAGVGAVVRGDVMVGAVAGLPTLKVLVV